MQRREFIQSTLTALAGTSLLGLKGIDSIPPIDYLTFDFHSHPGLFPTKGTEAFGEAQLTKTLAEMKTGQLTGAFFSMVADMKLIKVGPEGVKPVRSYDANEAWNEYTRQIKIVKELITNASIKFATQRNDLNDAFREKTTAAFISCEGGDFLEGQPDRIDKMYEDGVRSIQLVHYHPNELGDLQTEPPQHNGLSNSGKEVVRRMNKLKMIIDVAHATFETTKQVADVTDSPIILSHSILQTAGNRPLSKRAITIEHAKVVAQTGGVIGAWPSGFNTSFEDFIDNTLRLVDAVGVEHVGLGTDMDGNFKPVFASYLQLPQWINALKAKGLKEDEVKLLVGGNANRVLMKVL